MSPIRAWKRNVSSRQCCYQLVQCVLLVGVGHDDTVVLGSHVALDALSARGSALVDVLSLKSSNQVLKYDAESRYMEKNKKSVGN